MYKQHRGRQCYQGRKGAMCFGRSFEGRMLVVKQLAAWVMLACLISIQAHSFMPHHHHDRYALAHHHADHADSAQVHGTHHHELLHHADHEVSGHDEASLSGVTAPKSFHVDFAMVLPEPVRLVPPAAMPAETPAQAASLHPFATGPPGTKSSRAPPVSFRA
ncbi:MAG: hypothetical protein HONBIEJF_00428 [Fimbriimonadaceae bacterium]|nr:hypothetical protein [Fimbriimonadaceae bacterium]